MKREEKRAKRRMGEEGGGRARRVSGVVGTPKIASRYDDARSATILDFSQFASSKAAGYTRNTPTTLRFYIFIEAPVSLFRFRSSKRSSFFSSLLLDYTSGSRFFSSFPRETTFESILATEIVKRAEQASTSSTRWRK